MANRSAHLTSVWETRRRLARAAPCDCDSTDFIRGQFGVATAEDAALLSGALQRLNRSTQVLMQEGADANRDVLGVRCGKVPVRFCVISKMTLTSAPFNLRQRPLPYRRWRRRRSRISRAVAMLWTQRPG